MDTRKLTSSFFNSFHSNHVILYVGQNISNEDLRGLIADCPWSAVVTSRRDPEFSAFFANEERTPYECTSREQIKNKPLHRRNLPILRLFGIKGSEDDDSAATTSRSWLKIRKSGDLDAAYDFDNANIMVRLIPELMDRVNPLVMVGIDSAVDWELMGRYLAEYLYDLTSNGAVSFWGIPASVDEKYKDHYTILQRVAEEKSFGLYETSLAEVVRSHKEDENTVTPHDFALPDTDNDVFFQGQSPVSISRTELLRFKNVGTLLTERTITRIRPLGRVQQREWFSNFLELSASEGPQWYGYLPQSLFYVKRSYEDTLVQLVRKALSGQSITDGAEKNCPIILSGDPGSSKSITLGALAYRIYNEKNNPVIFIPGDFFMGGHIGAELDELDSAMQTLERLSDIDTRILLIWDSSTYRSGVEQAKRLLDKLVNARGRRCVLVCSSYNMFSAAEEADDTAGYRLADKTHFEKCDSSSATVLHRSGCYFVKATRTMDNREKFDFWSRIREYSGINEKTIADLKAKLADETEVFAFYYKLISLLRDNLEQGLSIEQKKVYQYVQNELHKVLGNIKAERRNERKLSAAYQAFLNAGFDLSDLEDEEPEALDDELAQNLDMFNLCVALFSRFKLEVPYSLAYTILIGGNRQDQYSKNHQELFNIVTTDIPWLYYGESKSGDYAFRFRNSLEADIYLRNHDISGEQQIDLLCQIIRIYGEDYCRTQYKDLNFTDNLQALLRLMGPNSTYTPFRQSHKMDHKTILEQLHLLIDAIEDLHDEYNVPDDDAGFASIVITFIREFYGHLWDQSHDPQKAAMPDAEPWERNPDYYSPDSYELRMQQLVDAISLAEHYIDLLESRVYMQSFSEYEKQHLYSQRDSLVVETAQCNIKLQSLLEEYGRLCKSQGLQPDKDFSAYLLQYRTLYSQLSSVIRRQPYNGYAYNALFKTFELMYEGGKLSDEKKLQYLSEILQIVESCRTLGSRIENRGSAGRDELGSHLAAIHDYVSGFRVTMDSLMRHRNGEPAQTAQEETFFHLYDEMLEANNPSAILFLCQKELSIPSQNRTLNTDERMRCARVHRFMTDPAHYNCIRDNSYALAMLIRVTWMLYNDTPLTSASECQITRLDMEQWKALYHLCDHYADIAREDKQPLIILLYALCSLQVNRLSESSFQEALDILNSINEDTFHEPRLRTPFMVCDEKGVPYTFSGTVISTKDRNGFIRVNGIPVRLGRDVGIRFHLGNLDGRTKMPEQAQVLSGLELGMGYTCFSLYMENGRQNRSKGARLV